MGHTKEGKEGIIARSNCNGPEEELLQPGGTNVKAVELERCEQTRHILGVKQTGLEKGNGLYMWEMSKKKIMKPSFRFEVLKRKLKNVTSNTGIEKQPELL